MSALAIPRTYKHQHKRGPFLRKHQIKSEPLKTLSMPEAFPFRPPLALTGTFVKMVACTFCEKARPESAVFTHPPEALNSDHMVLRQMYCDHCDHIQTWREKCSSTGELYGILVEAPGHVRSADAIARFLRKHPQAVGIS